MLGVATFLVPLLAGFGLGMVFFGGLWFTISAIPKSRHPALLVLTSFWVRTALVVAGILLVIDGLWQKALACLVGFLIARLVWSRWIPRGHSAEKGAL